MRFKINPPRKAKPRRKKRVDFGVWDKKFIFCSSFITIVSSNDPLVSKIVTVIFELNKVLDTPDCSGSIGDKIEKLNVLEPFDVFCLSFGFPNTKPLGPSTKSVGFCAFLIEILKVFWPNFPKTKASIIIRFLPVTFLGTNALKSSIRNFSVPVDFVPTGRNNSRVVSYGIQMSAQVK